MCPKYGQPKGIVRHIIIPRVNKFTKAALCFCQSVTGLNCTHGEKNYNLDMS